MNSELPSSIAEHFAALEDPHIERSKDHLLIDILTIAILAVICGADGWVGIETYSQAKESWLQTFLALPNGIPSHDTFGRVFARLDPEQLQACFLHWVRAVSRVTDGEVVAIDGKTVSRSYDTGGDKGAIHWVSAWASQNRLVLGQRTVDDKSNETLFGKGFEGSIAAHHSFGRLRLAIGTPGQCISRLFLTFCQSPNQAPGDGQGLVWSGSTLNLRLWLIREVSKRSKRSCHQPTGEKYKE